MRFIALALMLTAASALPVAAQGSLVPVVVPSGSAVVVPARGAAATPVPPAAAPRPIRPVTRPVAAPEASGAPTLVGSGAPAALSPIGTILPLLATALLAGALPGGGGGGPVATSRTR